MVKCFKVVRSCLEPGLLVSIASGVCVTLSWLCLHAEPDKLSFISSWHMSAVFLLSLLTVNIYLQKWVKQENALVTPRIRVSTSRELNITTTKCDALWHLCS